MAKGAVSLQFSSQGEKQHQIVALIIAIAYQVTELKKQALYKNDLSHLISNAESPRYPQVLWKKKENSFKSLKNEISNRNP